MVIFEIKISKNEIFPSKSQLGLARGLVPRVDYPLAVSSCPFFRPRARFTGRRGA